MASHASAFPAVSRRRLLHRFVCTPYCRNFAWALDYPTRSVNFIVPYPAAARPTLRRAWVGQSLSAGVGTQSSLKTKAAAQPDRDESAAKERAGRLYGACHTDIVTSAPHIFKMSHRPATRADAVVQLSHQPVVLAVHPRSVQHARRVHRARQNSGHDICDSGIGRKTTHHAEWFAALAGISCACAYRGGAPALNDLIAAREDRVTRLDAAHPASQSRNPTADGAIDGAACTDAADDADLPRTRVLVSGDRAVDRRSSAGWNARPGRRAVNLEIIGPLAKRLCAQA